MYLKLKELIHASVDVSQKGGSSVEFVGKAR
jgi:hypothetical protein